MGLSLSIISSAWNEVFGLKYFGLKHPVQKIIVRSLSLKSNSFKKKSDQSEIKEEKMGLERSLSFKSWDSTIEEKATDVEISVSAKDLGHDKKSLKLSNMRKPTISLPEPAIFSFSSPRPITELHAAATKDLGHDKKSLKLSNMRKPTISLPEPAIFSFSSPRPITELHAAATTVQKVFKSYRTRRNLADCAVVAEELWWKALDFASLETTSVSFYSIEKHETAVSKWTRVKKQAARVGKGLSKDENAQKLALQHWLEAIDPRHRYGHNLHIYYDIWFDSKSSQPFFYWLDIGGGKEINLEKCPRTKLQSQCIQYLGPKERESYEAIVENGKLVYRQSGLLIDTTEDCKWIFVLSTSRSLYIGQKKKGVFQHSSFLSGGATTAAGRLVAHDGILEAIWPYSGHYLPTEDNFKEFISFLEEHNVDLSNVERRAIDDDESSSFKIEVKESKSEAAKAINNADINEQEIKIEANAAKKEAVFDMNKRLSCKWASGVGPRIGCVRDYPSEMQYRALEQVNLSPRINPGQWDRCVPIPSPRPSPKIRISPRLSYMGLPSPRVSVTPAC